MTPLSPPPKGDTIDKLSPRGDGERGGMCKEGIGIPLESNGSSAAVQLVNGENWEILNF